ncbi:MAG: response regulator [Candidatus Koribacter versatilis]|uniref:Response regulator n=1 Tax=Candidatus Korobacter versatilis TaxID=658062 RepID=A0A932EQ01_9BACT|nr:response regulator [Candidatus Koribacter versatilis]
MTATTKPAVLPILVVEDEPSVMAFLQAALERSGYSVVTASSGVEALKLFETAEFRGVITDMRTPGGVSGADVHAWIVTNRPHLADRVILVTGDTVNEETVALLRKTNAPCVEKPFRVQQLLEVVQKIFGKAV